MPYKTFVNRASGCYDANAFRSNQLNLFDFILVYFFMARLPMMHILKLFSVFAFGVCLSSAFNYLIVHVATSTDEQAQIDAPQDKALMTPVPFHRGADPAAEEPNAEGEADLTAPVQREVKTAAQRGDTLLSFLRRGGIGASEAFEISGALKGTVAARELKTGQRMDVLLERSPENPELLTFKELKIIYPEKMVQVARKQDGALSVDDIAKPLEKKILRAEAVIRGSLIGAAEEAGIPDKVVQSLISTYSYDVDFQREIQEGDRLEVVYESMRDEAGAHVRSGDVLYARLTLSGKPLDIYYYTDSNGQSAFYNQDGKSVRRALLRTPINGARVSSRFGMRMHPVLGYSKMHRGVDFAAPTGTPIYAAGDGKVAEVRRKGTYGNYIRIRHNGEYSTAYAHLSRFASGLRSGARVKQGQVIGYVGSTGRSTGAHLHFELIRGNTQINPSSVKSMASGTLNKREMLRFKKQQQHLQQTMADLPTDEVSKLANIQQ